MLIRLRRDFGSTDLKRIDSQTNTDLISMCQNIPVNLCINHLKICDQIPRLPQAGNKKGDSP